MRFVCAATNPKQVGDPTPSFGLLPDPHIQILGTTLTWADPQRPARKRLTRTLMDHVEGLALDAWSGAALSLFELG
jgi:hypothetical protein